MKQRQLVKVIGTSITGMEGSRLQSLTARGITPLKRGQSVMDFIQDFLRERGVLSYSLNQRGDGAWVTSPMMFLNESPRRVLTYHFLQFDLSDLGYHAKDLTRAELDRDVRGLRKLVTPTRKD